MTDNNTTRTEYAIEVPGRGLIGWRGIVEQAPETGFAYEADAEDRLTSARHEYTEMGCPEIAETLRIISRTITLTRSDWTVEKVDA